MWLFLFLCMQKNSVQEGTIRQKLLRVNLEKLYMSRLTHGFLKEIKIQFR